MKYKVILLGINALFFLECGLVFSAPIVSWEEWQAGFRTYSTCSAKLQSELCALRQNNPADATVKVAVEYFSDQSVQLDAEIQKLGGVVLGESALGKEIQIAIGPLQVLEKNSSVIFIRLVKDKPVVDPKFIQSVADGAGVKQKYFHPLVGRKLDCYAGVLIVEFADGYSIQKMDAVLASYGAAVIFRVRENPLSARIALAPGTSVEDGLVSLGHDPAFLQLSPEFLPEVIHNAE